MSLFDNLENVLSQYTSGVPATANVESHFDQVAQAADPATLAHGIAAALQSGQTSLGQTVSQLFAQATPEQKTGMVNALLSAAPPSLRAEIGSIVPGAGTGAVAGAQAAALSPDAMAALASRIHEAGGGAVEKLSAFYAQHPTLVKTLGGAAMVLAMRKIAERQMAS